MLGRLLARIPPFAVDAAVALAFVVVSQIELHRTVDDGYQAGPLWLNVPLVFLMTAPVAFRRAAPVATLAVMVAAAAVPSVVVAHTLFFWGGLVPIALAVYSVARHGDGLSARFAWVAGMLVLLTGAIHIADLRSPSNVFFALGLFLTPWLVGRVLRRLSVQSAELSDALELLAEQQSARQQAAVHAERARIAVEMHDVVAHAVSLMVVQVGAARMELETGGADVPRLRQAEETGRQALAELRRTLGVMRSDPQPTTAPLPDLGSLPPLVEQFRSAGLDVHLQVGPLDELPPSLGLAVFRVLQEALTNVLKHAGRVRVEATVRPLGADLVVDVVNAVGRRAEPLPAGGHGLAGMHERVAMFGGTLVAAPTPAGGFRVHAVLPRPSPTQGAASAPAALGSSAAVPGPSAPAGAVT